MRLLSSSASTSSSKTSIWELEIKDSSTFLCCSLISSKWPTTCMNHRKIGRPFFMIILLLLESILSYFIILLTLINIFDESASRPSSTGFTIKSATAAAPTSANPTTWPNARKRQSIILKASRSLSSRIFQI